MLCTYQFKAGGGRRGDRAWDLIVIVVPGVRLLTDLAFSGEGIFESVFARRGDIWTSTWAKETETDIVFPASRMYETSAIKFNFRVLMFQEIIIDQNNFKSVWYSGVWSFYFLKQISFHSESLYFFAAFADTRTVSQRVCWFCWVFTLIRCTCLRRRLNGYSEPLSVNIENPASVVKFSISSYFAQITSIASYFWKIKLFKGQKYTTRSI